MLRLTNGRWVEWREEQDSTHRPSMQIGRTLHTQNAYPDLIQAPSFWSILPDLIQPNP